MDQIHLPPKSRHLGEPSGASKMVFEPMLCLAQIVDQSWTDTNIISKQTEMRFHMTHATKVFYRSVQNDFSAYGTFDANRAPILR
jgi:hypothetical protein